MKKILLLITFLFGTIAFAGPKIKQIDTAKERVAVTATKQTTVGSQWMISTKNGTPCSLEVTDKVGNIAILDASSCSNLNQIKVGQRIEKSLFSDTSTGRTRTKRGVGPAWLKKLKGVSLVGFYSMADELPYKAGSTAITAKSDKTFGFGAEYNSDMTEFTDGLPMSLVSGFTYELSRDINSFHFNGQTRLPQGVKPNFRLLAPYVNALYWVTQSVGGFAGINYSIPFESDFGDTKLKSQLGYQVGVSGQLTNKFAVDGVYRWINMKGSDISDVSLDGLVLRGRYIF